MRNQFRNLLNQFNYRVPEPCRIVRGMPSKAASAEDFASHCAELVERTMTSNGVPAARAVVSALELINEMRRHFGGLTFYFAKRARPDAGESAAEVYAAWSSGQTISTIAEQRGWTDRYVYKLLGRERDRLSTIRAASAASRRST